MQFVRDQEESKDETHDRDQRLKKNLPKFADPNFKG